jgi:hypothetical protein
MKKYFEDNRLVGSSLISLHDCVTEATNIVASNLFFREAHDIGEQSEHKSNLAASCYNLIAACEAIIETYANEDAENALERSREAVRRVSEPYEDAASLIKMILGL